VSTNRTRELWTDRERSGAYVVELEDDRVLAAQGPIDPSRLDDIGRAWTAPTDGRAPAFTSLRPSSSGGATSSSADRSRPRLPRVRAVRCWCEELVVAEDDEALVAALRDHVSDAHPGHERSDKDISARVQAEAYEPPDRPPWAY
jgi:hypothetical protein